MIHFLGGPPEVLEILHPFQVARAYTARVCQDVRDQGDAFLDEYVIGPLAPSATSFALMLRALFSVMTSSSAAGTSMSTSSSSSSSFEMFSDMGKLAMLVFFFL